MPGSRDDGERERLMALGRLGVLDTSPEEAFDRIALLARQHFNAPIAMISFAGEGRHWFKSCFGLDIRETRDEHSFCGYVTRSGGPLVVLDSSLDARFRHNALANLAQPVRFYAGAPLMAQGNVAVGALGVMDVKPREGFTPAEEATLGEFAALVVREIEIRHAAQHAAGAEERARSGEEAFSRMLASAPFGFYRTTPDGRILAANDAVLAMLGYDSLDDLMQHNLESESLVEERARFKASIESAGRVADYETVWRRKDGKPVHVRENARLVRSETGEILYYEGTMADITARRVAEEQRRQAQSLVEKIVNTLPTVLYLLEIPRHKCIYVNPPVENVLGYASAEFEGADNVLESFAHPDDRAALEQHHLGFRSIRDPEIRETTGRFRHRDGGWRWLRVRETVFSRNEDGEPVQILGAAMDFTDQHAMEQKIRLQEERWNLALAANNDGIFDWDIESGRVYRSRRCLDIFGCPGGPETGAPEDWKPVVHEDDRGRVEEAVRRYLDGFDPAFDVEFRIRTRGREVRWVRSRAQGRWDERGKPVRLVGSISDVTARKQTEIAVRLQADWLAEARDRAEAATSAKSRFLATMSHEIRTPLNAILGMAHLLLDSRLSREQFECADTIRGAGSTLLALVEDILDFSKIEAARMEIETIEFELLEIVEEALELLAPQAEDKGLDLQSWIDPRAPARVLGDAARLRQILLNLLSNAVKFTATGEVLVHVERQTRASGPDTVLFSVADTGIGISADEQRHLFQAFSQADSSTTRRFGGTGLGLAICKQLVELMGGQIGVESQPGAGSRFWFEIPFRVAREEAAEPPPELSGRRALVACGNEHMRSVIQKHLDHMHCESVLCANAGQVIEALQGRAQRADFALIDEGLPGESGSALVRRLRKLSQYRAFPVVLLRPRRMSASLRSRRPRKALAFLSKPIRRRALYAVLSQLLDAHPQAAESGGLPLASAARQGLRVLLAEDNRANQRVATLMLERIGYSVDVVSNGREAVEAYRRHAYPAILMDCQMPVMDGMAAAREVRRLENGNRRAVIIALTANALAEDRDQCFAAGMDDYLVKPVMADLLREKLEQWLVAGGPPPRQ